MTLISDPKSNIHLSADKFDPLFLTCLWLVTAAPVIQYSLPDCYNKCQKSVTVREYFPFTEVTPGLLRPGFLH